MLLSFNGRVQDGGPAVRDVLQQPVLSGAAAGRDSAGRVGTSCSGRIASTRGRHTKVRVLPDQGWQVLLGAKPSELPIIQTTRIELIINLKAAKAIGLALPPQIVDCAEEVIE